jgi:hypothetical protein
MVAFHQELRGVLPKSVFVVAGPYWALNVVLWARGLAEYTAIGVGSGFQYYVPGGPLSQGKNRVVVPPLRRQAIASSDLTAWVTQAEAAVVQGSPTAKELADLRRSLPQLIPDKELAKRQIAIWYKNWIERLEQAPPAGRALALYQDLSAAYVAGREIQLRLPRAEKVTRPERVAQQLMMSCL